MAAEGSTDPAPAGSGPGIPAVGMPGVGVHNLDRLKWLTAFEQRDFCKGACASALQEEAKLMKDFQRVAHLLRSLNEHCIVTSEADPEWDTEEVQMSNSKRLESVQECIEQLESNPPEVPPDLDITVDAIKAKMYGAFASTLHNTSQVTASLQDTAASVTQAAGDSEKLQALINKSDTATAQIAGQAEKAGKQLTHLAKGALSAIKIPQAAGQEAPDPAPSTMSGGGGGGERRPSVGGHVPYDPPVRAAAAPVASPEPVPAAAAAPVASPELVLAHSVAAAPAMDNAVADSEPVSSPPAAAASAMTSAVLTPSPVQPDDSITHAC